jgi:hypothetical protein
MQSNRNEAFKNANIFDILEKIEEEQIKYGREPVKEEVNDIHSSPLKNLPSEQHSAGYDPNDPDREEREAKEAKEQEQRLRDDEERANKYRNNAFLATLKSQQKRPPHERTELKDWVEPKGPGREGYIVGKKKGWNTQAKVMNIPGRGRVVVGFDDIGQADMVVEELDL